MKQGELVLVVPRRALFDGSAPAFQGFVAGDGEPYLSRIDAHGTFLARERAEEDAAFKQIIPYGVVLYDQSVLVTRRSADGGESRLHHKVSIGVGGHVNPGDGDGRDAIRSWVLRCLRRELDEELVLDTPWSWEIAGVLNDDSNSVGQVHFGVVFRVRPQSRAVRVREEELLEGDFVPIQALADHRGDMETWSAIVVGALLPSTR